LDLAGSSRDLGRSDALGQRRDVTGLQVEDLAVVEFEPNIEGEPVAGRGFVPRRPSQGRYW
jgi:hypothetical protein